MIDLGLAGAAVDQILKLAFDILMLDHLGSLLRGKFRRILRGFCKVFLRDVGPGFLSGFRGLGSGDTGNISLVDFRQRGSHFLGGGGFFRFLSQINIEPGIGKRLLCESLCYGFRNLLDNNLLDAFLGFADEIGQWHEGNGVIHHHKQLAARHTGRFSGTLRLRDQARLQIG